MEALPICVILCQLWIPSLIYLIYKIILYESLCILVRGAGFQPWLSAHGIQCYILSTAKCPLRLSVSSSSTLFIIYYLKASRFLSQRLWTSMEEIIAHEILLSNNSCLFHENMNHMIKLYLPPQANVLRLPSFFPTLCLLVLLQWCPLFSFPPPVLSNLASLWQSQQRKHPLWTRTLSYSLCFTLPWTSATTDSLAYSPFLMSSDCNLQAFRFWYYCPTLSTIPPPLLSCPDRVHTMTLYYLLIDFK